MQLPPYYIVGFTDADGCFTLNIRRWERNNTGFSASATYIISQREKYRWVMESIKETLDCGTIIQKHHGNRNHSPQVQYHVCGIEYLIGKVIPFFKKYPPILKKADFDLWRKGVELIHRGEHLNNEGILKLVELREQMNFKPGQHRIYTREVVEKLLKR